MKLTAPLAIVRNKLDISITVSAMSNGRSVSTENSRIDRGWKARDVSTKTVLEFWGWMHRLYFAWRHQGKNALAAHCLGSVTCLRGGDIGLADRKLPVNPGSWVFFGIGIWGQEIRGSL